MKEIFEPEENHKSGWIKIYRSVKNHWLYEPARKRTKLEAWYDLLLQAKHGQKKETIGYDLIIIERGQILTSQDRLSRDWRWDRSAVRAFLNSLHYDQMLTIETTNKFTMITICNYDTYQGEQPALSPTKQHQTNTTSTHTIINKNIKKVNNINSSIDVVTKVPTIYELIIEFWLKEFHIGWTFSAKHGKEVKSLITKITGVLKNGVGDASDEKILESFKAICNNLPDWYKDKDLGIINSKFNEIITEIKNKKNGKSINGTKQHSAEVYRTKL